jgi:threonine/homoserine/homoserine lactone efflux protein
MNLVNPKVLLFFIAYFPNFLFSETLSISLQFLILGSIFIFQALIVFSSVSLASNKLVSYLKVDTADYRLTYFKAFVFCIIGLSILLL